MPYRFFFSYSRETYKASTTAGGVNQLDQFFEDLTKQVSLLTGEKIEEVAARDIDHLRLSDSWSDELVKLLQASAVLVCVMTPHYFRSTPCGREVKLFLDRFAQIEHAAHTNAHRILPVFWIDEPQCYHAMHDHVKEFMRSLQLTEKGLPDNYPRVGLLHHYGRGDTSSCYSFRELLARRIKELSELPILPSLRTQDNFGTLASFFDKREIGEQDKVAVGPLGTNVVYAVATEKMDGQSGTTTIYAREAEDWRPFVDKPNRTIGRVTENALTDSGQRATDYRTIRLSEDLLARIREARKVNSPVLIVLDKSSLQYKLIRERLREYDDYDGPHIGLVTAGGDIADDQLVREVFQMKCGQHRPHHLWTVPPDSAAYERSVASVISALRADLQKLSASTVPVPPSTMPSL